MTAGTSRVSVLMAVYNGAAFLRQAVDSILAQSYADFEFLVIDDGSTDESANILRSYTDSRLRVIRNEHNLGLTASLNKGLQLAGGELVARQDADDVSHPERLQKQVAFLDRHAHVAVVGTQARYIDTTGRPSVSLLWWKPTTPEVLRLQLLFDSPFFHTSVLFRRAIVQDRLGGYNPSFRTSQDFELWSRLLLQFEGANLADTLVDQRHHSRSVSASYKPSNARQVAAVFAANLRALLGDCPQYAHWPALWSALMNPQMTPDRPPSVVFRAIDSICDAYIERGLAAPALAEVNMLRAITSLRAARSVARISRFAALRAVPRIYFMSPRLVAEELRRLGRGVLNPMIRT